MIQRIEENHFTKEKLKDILQSAFTAIQEDVTNRRRIEDGKTDMNSVSILEKGFKVL